MPQNTANPNTEPEPLSPQLGDGPARDQSNPSIPSPGGESQGEGAGDTLHSHRRTGKIARLPKALRDKLDQLLEDGLPYAEIIRALESSTDPPLPYPLSEQNISGWKDGGHQDWLLHRDWIAQIRLGLESAGDVVHDSDTIRVNQAALQVGSLHIFEALRNLAPGSLDKKLGGDSRAFTRLIHALARASRETLQLQKYKDACAKAREALALVLDPKRELTESERRVILQHADNVLGFPSS